MYIGRWSEVRNQKSIWTRKKIDLTAHSVRLCTVCTFWPPVWVRSVVVPAIVPLSLVLQYILYQLKLQYIFYKSKQLNLLYTIVQCHISAKRFETLLNLTILMDYLKKYDVQYFAIIFSVFLLTFSPSVNCEVTSPWKYSTLLFNFPCSILLITHSKNARDNKI